MKKIILALSIASLSSLLIMAYNINKYPHIEEYEKLIEMLNNELGASISIPDDKRGEVYNNIKNIPLDEFEMQLRENCNEVKDLPDEIYLNQNMEKSKLK